MQRSRSGEEHVPHDERDDDEVHVDHHDPLEQADPDALADVVFGLVAHRTEPWRSAFDALAPGELVIHVVQLGQRNERKTLEDREREDKHAEGGHRDAVFTRDLTGHP